ncbi:MAG TPA: hypothetical protein VH482_07260 [Thermomicrobiales bacterium]
MATTADIELPPVQELTVEETRDFFDRMARELLGIGADEFRRRWNAGEYDAIADDGDHSDIMYLALLGNLW